MERHNVKEMDISDDGIDLIVHFEGIFLKAYMDPVGVPTIGIGRIKGVTKADVINKRTITKQEAYDFLREDLEDEAKRYLKAWIHVPLLQCQYDALVSFCYNRGAGRFREKIVDQVNAEKWKEAADTLLEYDYSRKNGKKVILEGLARRRAAERLLFQGRDWTPLKEVRKWREIAKKLG